MTTDEKYKEALDELYNSFNAFHKVGAAAYCPGLDTALALDKAFGNPAQKIACVHIAGTNGKGSTAHTLAAVLSASGYKTGLFTSPHLIDFRERIRINGEMIPKERVVNFMERWREMKLPLSPSFFEITSCMAFDYFAQEEIDIAVIEVGLGGRLDSTNIITPKISIITNISLDHTALLGSTEEEIAVEKAAIIKPGVPVVIGEAEGKVRRVFEEKAHQSSSPIVFAGESGAVRSVKGEENETPVYDTPFGRIRGELTGSWQHKNAATILTTLMELQALGFSRITPEAIADGFAHVKELTGLEGRWSVISEHPTVITDTGHNVGGWKYLAKRLASIQGRKNMIIGFVADKDIDAVLRLISEIQNTQIWITQASTPRALPAEALAEKARNAGLNVADTEPSVFTAYKKALAASSESDTVFVGGSTFVVADLLEALKRD